MTDETLPLGENPESIPDEILAAPGGPQKTISVFLTQKGIEPCQVNLDGGSLEMRKEGEERYYINGELARGGMGAVLNAKDLSLRRDVAMKVVLNPRAARDEHLVRFVHEAQVTGQLEHPSIVPVYELGVGVRTSRSNP